MAAAAAAWLLLVEQVPCPRFALIHSAHEGSHAIAQAFANDYGSPQLLELMDNRHWPGALDVLRRVKLAFFAGELDTLGMLLQNSTYLDHPIHIPTEEECHRGMVVGALLRRDIVKLTTYVKGTLSIFILIRTDLMRWALSFPQTNDVNCLHPQFGKCATSSIKQVVNVTALVGQVNKLVSDWRQKAKTAVQVAKALRCPAFILYEDFLASNRAVTKAMLTQLAHDADLANSTAPGDVRVLRQEDHALPVVFRKQHGHDIRSWVANADDVIHHFAESTYPTWEQVSEASGFSRFCPAEAK